MGRRLGARLIDWTLMSSVLFVLGFVILGATSFIVDGDSTASDGANAGVWLGVSTGLFLLTLVVTFGYEVVFIALWGRTVGKMATGAKVVREVDGLAPGWSPSLLRLLIPVIGSLACGIGLFLVYLSPFFDGSGRLQGWHDKVAGTVVIRP